MDEAAPGSIPSSIAAAISTAAVASAIDWISHGIGRGIEEPARQTGAVGAAIRHAGVASGIIVGRRAARIPAPIGPHQQHVTEGRGQADGHGDGNRGGHGRLAPPRNFVQCNIERIPNMGRPTGRARSLIIQAGYVNLVCGLMRHLPTE